MAAFQFWVSLEKDHYQPGEALHGEVLLSVAKQFPCDGIFASLEWFVEGKDAISGQRVKTKRLLKKNQPGDHRIPFSFQAPSGPFTYQGKLFSVRWRVLVTVELPWAEDLRKGAIFTLSPSPQMSSADRYFCGPAYKPDRYAANKGLLSSALLRLSERMLGKPEVSLSKQLVCRGDTISVQLSFSAQRDLSFGGTFVALSSQESAKAGQEIMHQSCVPLLVEDDALTLDPYRGGPAQEQTLQKVKSGASYVLRATLPISEEAPFTFVAPAYSIESVVCLYVEILGWPDWSLEFPVTIRPGRLLERPDELR